MKHTSFLYDRDGEMHRYIIDFESRTMYKMPPLSLEFLGCEYRSSIEPWFVVFPLWIVAELFFHGNPIWSWGLKEVPCPKQ